MTTYWRRRLLLASLILAVALGTGCDILSLPFFLFAPEPKREAELLKLASADKTKQVKVAILASNGLEVRPEFLRADYQLSEFLAHHLKELCQYNKENVVILSPRKVEEFKNSHPNWNRGEMELAEIGRLLKADYVISMEINSLTLYEEGSLKELFRGQADIRVMVVNVNEPDEGPKWKDFHDVYPEEGPAAAGIDKQPQQFREEFLNHAAKKLAWFFTAHPTRDSYNRGD
jgi:hypothetical protein